jgi:hypothetical protein
MAELMTAVFSFAGSDHEVRKGFQLPSDHALVKRFPRFFVPVAAGEEAAVRRAGEIERETAALRDRQRDELRDARIAMGTKWAAEDDANVEACKKSVRANSDLQLVHDPLTGLVLGVRTKAEVIESRRRDVERAQQNALAEEAQRAAFAQAERER